MRLPLLARSTCSLMALLATSVLLGACSDTVAPVVAETESVSAESPFVPSAASMALVGVSDGKYTFQVDPTQTGRLFLGANLLYLPANSICDLETSGYGASTWKSDCTPETEPLTITAVVRGAGTRTPRIDFLPQMRFHPETKVSLYMYVPDAQDRKAAKSWVVEYCDDANVCIDESLTDRSLITRIDPRSKVVFRRIKHFSGYILNTGIVEDAVY